MIALIAAALLTAPPPLPVSPWVALSGQVVWPKGKDWPEPAAVVVATDKAHCCGAGPVLDESLVVDPRTRGIKGAIVWLRPDDTDPKSFFPKERIHPDLAGAKPTERLIDMPRCQFVPRILAARAGDVLKVKNPAPVVHTLKLDGTANQTNRVLPARQDAIVAIESLKNENNAVSIQDAIHPWMAGYLRVFDHPYFAVTDAEGRFEIPKVPAGTWRIVYWHERGYHKGRDDRYGFPVTVKDNGAAKQAVPPVEYEFPKSD